MGMAVGAMPSFVADMIGTRSDVDVVLGEAEKGGI